VKTNKVFVIEMKKIKKCRKSTTIIWVSWYKKSAGIVTNFTEIQYEILQLEMNLLM